MNNLNSLQNKLIPQFLRRRLVGREELQKIIANTGWLVADKVIQIVINLSVGVWVARYLGPDQRGIMLYATSFVSLIVPLSALGLGAILIRELVHEPEAKGELMGTVFVIQSISYLLFIPLIILAVYVLRTGEPYVQWAVIIIALGNIFKTARIFNFWFNSQLQSKYVVLATRIVEFFIAGIRIVLILVQASLFAFIAVTALQIALYFFAKLFFYVRTGEMIRVWRFNSTRAKNMLRDSWPLAFSFLAVTLYLQIDSVMLGQLLGNTAVGLYGEAARFANIWYFIPGAIAISTYPALVRARQSVSPFLYRRRVQQFLDILSLTGYIFAIPIAFAAPFVVNKLYGPAYSETGYILVVIVWTFIFVSLRYGMDRWLLVENLTKISMWSVFLGVITNIGLNIVLIPLLGEKGAAWATVISIAVSIYIPCLVVPKLRPLFVQLWLALIIPFRIHQIFIKR